MTGRTAVPVPTRRRLAVVLVAVGAVATVAAALGIGVAGADDARAAVDEPQYLLSALSLWEDGDLDIADELAAGRAAAYHAAELPVQTAERPDGSQLSPHDPLLALLLAPAVGLGGWVAAKVVLAVLAGGLAALTGWVAVRRLAVPLPVAGVVAAVAFGTAPLAVYGQQVYPELPAALLVMVAVAALTGPSGRAGSLGWALAVVGLPWLSVKYTPVAAVLAVAGLVLLWRHAGPRVAGGGAALLALAGGIFLAVHQAVYGGWTAYASGDHFQAGGELTVVGASPDYLGRAGRLGGLLLDRDFGLAAWQPAWLLLVPALAALPWLAPARWPIPVAALAVGWLVATFAALTMHGFWFPGRQVVVVLPLGVLAVAGWLGHVHRRSAGPARTAVLTVAGLAGTAGVATYGWLLAAGWSGGLTWVGAPDAEVPAVLAWWRAVLPDHRDLGGGTLVLDVGWAVALLGLAVAAARSARRAARADRFPPPPDSDDPTTMPRPANPPAASRSAPMSSTTARRLATGLVLAGVLTGLTACSDDGADVRQLEGECAESASGTGSEASGSETSGSETSGSETSGSAAEECETTSSSEESSSP